MPFHLPKISDLSQAQRVLPHPVPDPYWIGYSKKVGSLLGIEQDSQLPTNSEYLQLLAGNQTKITGLSFEPFATAYSGHQFGQWAGQLGDGRAIYLGDMNGYEIQLKGAGPTAYSRRGDGRAVLRSSVREFLASEAMNGLGIPSSRALSVVGSDLTVIRESAETAAICARVAPSFLRIGHLEHYGHNEMDQELEQTLDFLIEHHYKECQQSPTPYLELLRSISTRIAHTTAQWQSVGFCHGVLNTDNISLLGLTLDYGPFGFLDTFDNMHICNHSDHSGRYAYHRQSEIMHWNLYCMASAMLQPLQKELAKEMHLNKEDAIQKIKETLDIFSEQYAKKWQSLFRQKVGLNKDIPEDIQLLEQLMQSLHQQKLDFTLFFRDLSEGNDCPSVMSEWHELYQERLLLEKTSLDHRLQAMRAINPKYILRNHLAQRAIESAQKKDFSEVSKLLNILENPYESQMVSEDYANPPPPEMMHISISCSS
jgi:uncharacterized protein YdiU (UPF0061 family)